jgi:exodeoxyribonuclease V gamma subunit
VPEIAEHTFAWAMDRLIAGYAVGSSDGDETVALALPDMHIAPLDGVHGPQAALVGALDALLVEVDAWSRAGSAPRAASAWAAGSSSASKHCSRSIQPTARHARRRRSCCASCARWPTNRARRPGSAARLRGRARRAARPARRACRKQQRFLLGGITFCGMVPQRSIPFEVVAVLASTMASSRVAAATADST